MPNTSPAITALEPYILAITPKLDSDSLRLPITIGVVELACIFKIHPDHVYRLLKSDPDRLPPHVRRTKPKQRLVWILDDVLAWMRRGQHHQSAVTQVNPRLGHAHVSSKRIGRPTKAEQIARREGATHG